MNVDAPSPLESGPDASERIQVERIQVERIQVERIRPERIRIDEEECRVFRRTAELAGKKWNAAILMSVLRGAERFSSIREDVAGISDRLLAVRLRELEQQGLISRTVLPSIPAQIRYALTPAGEELIRILHPLVQWTRRWDRGERSAVAAPQAHERH